MNSKSILTALESPTTRLVIALVCGVGAALLIYSRQEQYLLKQTGGERHSVVISKVALTAGDRIEMTHLDTLDVPESYRHPSSIPTEAAPRIATRKLYRDVKANQPLLWTDFDSAEGEHAATSTAKGMRAAVVPMHESLAKSRLLSPNDYIDVLATLQQGDRGSVTVTLLQRIKVLELLDSAAIVQLTPEQAERLYFASQHGTLNIVVRNREDEEQRELPSISAQNLVRGYDLSDRLRSGTANPSAKDSAELLRALMQGGGGTTARTDGRTR